VELFVIVVIPCCILFFFSLCCGGTFLVAIYSGRCMEVYILFAEECSTITDEQIINYCLCCVLSELLPGCIMLIVGTITGTL
jgi:hypothetical protein